MTPVPYPYKREEAAIISRGLDWDSAKCNAVKNKIRMHIFKEFNRQCVYCRSEIEYSSAFINIDHIVHKSFYRNFTFRPENLAPCCQKCNTAKKEKETLELSLRNFNHLYEDYPITSSSYIIVHPYFDKYEEHLVFEDDVFIFPYNNSPKGKNTIEICNLTRLPLAESRIKKGIHLGDILTEATKRGTFDEVVKQFNCEGYQDQYRKREKLQEVFSDPEILLLADNCLKLNNENGQSINFYCTKFLLYNEKIEKVLQFLKYVSNAPRLKRELLNYMHSKTNRTTLFDLVLDNVELMNLKTEIQNNRIPLHVRTKTTLLQKLSNINLTNLESKFIKSWISKISEIESIFEGIVINNDLYEQIIDLTRLNYISIQKIIHHLDTYNFESVMLQKRKFTNIVDLYAVYNNLHADSKFEISKISEYQKMLKSASRLCEI